MENDDIDEILGGPSRRRRRRDKVERDLPPHLSLLPIEHDRKSPAESQQRPLMFSLVEGKYARHASPTPPLMPAVAYNTRPGHAEPAIATTEHEYSSALLSEEEFALLVRYLDIHIHNQILFVLYFSIYDIYHQLNSQIPVSPLGFWGFCSRSTNPYLYPGCRIS